MSTNDITKPSEDATGKAVVEQRFHGARSPGKIIISGEHSVVYGAPALAVAVQHYTEIWFTPLHRAGGLRTAFESLAPSAFYPFEALKGFAKGLDARFDDFLRGEIPVQKILHRPDDLAVYTLTSLLTLLPVPGRTQKLGLPAPGQLSSRSEMPLGAGMGSSAAVVAATIVLYEHMLNIPQSAEQRFEKVRFCERLQHGRGSAIDASAVVFGGLNRVQDSRVTTLPPDETSAPFDQDWYWILTGTPASKTGECVSHVRAYHGDDHALWAEFEACTNEIEALIRDGGDPVALIRQNHRLLCRIGVVSEATAALIGEVESLGGAAKISGAGTIRGKDSGVMLAYLPDRSAMTHLMETHRVARWEPLKISQEGAHLYHVDAPDLSRKTTPPRP